MAMSATSTILVSSLIALFLAVGVTMTLIAIDNRGGLKFLVPEKKTAVTE